MFNPLFRQLPAGARVLFIRLRNLGEAVLDTANLRALKRFRPDLEVTTLVEAIFADLFSADSEIAVLALERSARDRRSTLRARFQVIKEIRSRNFHAVINLHGGPASAQLAAASGAPHRVGAAHFRFAYIYNWQVPPAEDILGRKHLHTVESQFAAFKWLGLAADEPAPTSLIVDPERRRTAREKLRASGVDPEAPYAVLAPTNEFYTKRWLPERYAAVAEELSKRGLQVVLTGAPTDEQRAQMAEVQQQTSMRLAQLSTLTIGELVALIAGSRLFVGNDSGPAHIAAAVKTPLVVLFGPASAERWRPWRAPSVLLQNDFPCNPCSMYTCEAFAEPECIRSITIEQVMRGIDEALEWR